MGDAGYLFDNAGGETPTRFAGLEGLWDESTIRYLSKIGVGAGWTCWEVGAGGGSIARWLAERVAPSGTVLATDLDLTRIPDDSIIVPDPVSVKTSASSVDCFLPLMMCTLWTPSINAATAESATPTACVLPSTCGDGLGRCEDFERTCTNATSRCSSMIFPPPRIR